MPEIPFVPQRDNGLLGVNICNIIVVLVILPYLLPLLYLVVKDERQTRQ